MNCQDRPAPPKPKPRPRPRRPESWIEASHRQVLQQLARYAAALRRERAEIDERLRRVDLALGLVGRKLSVEEARAKIRKDA